MDGLWTLLLHAHSIRCLHTRREELQFRPTTDPAVRGLTASPASSLDVADALGWTAYHHACAAGHQECVLVLLLAGCGTTHLTPTGGQLGGQTGWGLAAGPPSQVGVLQLLRRVVGGQHGGAERVRR
jgi:ankyrin repeat protein